MNLLQYDVEVVRRLLEALILDDVRMLRGLLSGSVSRFGRWKTCVEVLE